jgi:hypothetical protein
MRKIYILFLVLLVSGCFLNQDDDHKEKKENLLNFTILAYFFRLYNNSNYDNLNTYYTTMKNLEVQVVYQSGAEPFAGVYTNPKTLTSQSIWKLFMDNINYIFTYRGQNIKYTIPTELSSMQSINEANRSSWTITDLEVLANKYRTQPSSIDTGRFFVAFLNGYFNDNGTINQNIIGLNVSRTPYIFIFKQVITSSSAINSTKIFMEQSTLIHEMGHALGLVNNGVPLTTSHQDISNGKHCTNTLCVMYYANGGINGLISFLQSYLTSSSNIIIGKDCLDDIKNYK